MGKWKSEEAKQRLSETKKKWWAERKAKKVVDPEPVRDSSDDVTHHDQPDSQVA